MRAGFVSLAPLSEPRLRDLKRVPVGPSRQGSEGPEDPG